MERCVMTNVLIGDHDFFNLMSIVHCISIIFSWL